MYCRWAFKSRLPLHHPGLWFTQWQSIPVCRCVCVCFFTCDITRLLTAWMIAVPKEEDESMYVMPASESAITVRLCVSANSTLCSAWLPYCSRANRAFLSSDWSLASVRRRATFSMNVRARLWFSRPILSEPSSMNTTSTGRWTQLATAGSETQTHTHECEPLLNVCPIWCSKNVKYLHVPKTILIQVSPEMNESHQQ